MLLRHLILFIVCSSQSFAQEKLESSFHLSSIFNVTERLNLNCSQVVLGIRSLVDCSTQCLRFKPLDCSGISLDSHGTCFIHQECPFLFERHGEVQTHYYLVRIYSGGYESSTSSSSELPESIDLDGSVIHPAGCYKKKKKDYNLVIDPDQRGENPIRVTCIGYSPSVVLFRSQGRASFNRTWEEYKKGFYVDALNQWLGLDAWHKLSNAGCNIIRTRLVLADSFKGYPMTYTKTSQFSLSSEDDNFSFDFSVHENYSRNMPGNYEMAHCFGDHQRTPFSTWNRDNDGDPGKNCAAMTGAGWWYSQGCDRKCNLFGGWPEHWDTTPPEQRLYLEGADLASMLRNESFVEIALQECFD